MIFLENDVDLCRAIYSSIYYSLLSFIHFLRFGYGLRCGYNYIWILMVNDVVNYSLGFFSEDVIFGKPGDDDSPDVMYGIV